LIYAALAQQLGATLITLDVELRRRAQETVLAHTPVEALKALKVE
jgi:predicted nucleic acid-binding protein